MCFIKTQNFQKANFLTAKWSYIFGKFLKQMIELEKNINTYRNNLKSIYTKIE